MRVTHKTIARDQATDTRYLVTLELVPQSVAVPGFHQVVLASNGPGGTAISSPGTYTFQWVGSTSGEPSGPLTAVVQDTDGYSGSIVACNDYSGSPITQIMIPIGLGGTYTVGMEGIHRASPWWPSGSCPSSIAYVPGNGNCSFGTAAGALPASWVYAIIKNGTTTIASATYSDSRSGLYFVDPLTHIPPTSVALADGDIITATITTPWTMGNNAYGCELPSYLPGCLYLTRTGG